MVVVVVVNGSGRSWAADRSFCRWFGVLQKRTQRRAVETPEGAMAALCQGGLELFCVADHQYKLDYLMVRPRKWATWTVSAIARVWIGMDRPYAEYDQTSNGCWMSLIVLVVVRMRIK